MGEILYKLSPHRDLQCYFERPSGIAAMSEASATGFTVSGTWRQQFDWAVIEWNVHNVFEHPVHRNLPDGNLSGLRLVYEETRDNCIPMDSDLFPTVDWPYLRVWTRDGGADSFYQVRLRDHAVPIEGAYVAASAEMELSGTPAAGDYVGISFLSEHHTYQAVATDEVGEILDAIAASITTFSTSLEAERSGAVLRITRKDVQSGATGNRLGVYGFATGGSLAWSPWWVKFSGGQSPTKWRVTLDFSSLVAIDGRTVPATKVRKMRWTYAAAMQDDSYQRSEFAARISGWTVTGTGRAYQIAGPGSRRIEDGDPALVFSSGWEDGRGNFSGGSIRHTQQPGASATCQYTCPAAHKLYLGTRYTFNSGSVTAQVDSRPPVSENLHIAGEDTLARLFLGDLTAGTHTVTITFNGPAGEYLYVDFLEMAFPFSELPEFPEDGAITLATDWDTDHSIAIAPERTAWMIHALGFHGRQNHYVGALWFYEMIRDGHAYAFTTVTFSGAPAFSETTTLTIGTIGSPDVAVISHLHRVGDTAATVAKSFELILNRGYTAVWAQVSGNVLTIRARAMGTRGHAVTIAASTTGAGFSAVVSESPLAGGVDGAWHTDLAAPHAVNRAARDWSREFYRALDVYEIPVVAAFSMELQHGDDSLAAGIAQRYPDGSAAWLNTPALQTNFSPASTNYWKQVHADMAATMAEAGVTPYLQFGEVQWWYFPKAGSGMPFHDDYTKSRFLLEYGRPMAAIASGSVDPALFPDEAELLPLLIGEFTGAVMAYVRASHPDARFEVLWPNDVNEGPFNRVINYPAGAWTPATLDCLKTESFTYTFARNLNLARTTVEYPVSRGFSRDKRSFLVGLMDPFTSWDKEVNFARSSNIESIVLFALDQYCLMGYETPMPASLRRAARMG